MIIEKPNFSQRLNPEYQGQDSIFVMSYTSSGRFEAPRTSYFCLSGSNNQLQKGLADFRESWTTMAGASLEVLREYHGTNSEALGFANLLTERANRNKLGKPLDLNALDKILLAAPKETVFKSADSSVKVARVG